ncbi:mucin-12-like [Anopheles funestus]|uniref:mucin-12-like n=1 Tax=Anopheles funestus TaxID=62324 RepID=UPI0020C67F6E|nr:mucin-12-like [Anopheles funestus]
MKIKTLKESRLSIHEHSYSTTLPVQTSPVIACCSKTPAIPSRSKTSTKRSRRKTPAIFRASKTPAICLSSTTPAIPASCTTSAIPCSSKKLPNASGSTTPVIPASCTTTAIPCSSKKLPSASGSTTPASFVTPAIPSSSKTLPDALTSQIPTKPVMCTVSSGFGNETNSLTGAVYYHDIPSKPSSPLQDPNKISCTVHSEQSSGTEISHHMVAIRQELKSIRQGQEYMLTSFECAMEAAGTLTPSTSFSMQPINSKELMVEFDARLADPDYMAQVIAFLKRESGEYRPFNLMHRSIDLLFGMEFFASCSWSGVGIPLAKIPFKIHTNIIKLFCILGATNGVEIPEWSIREYFKDKFYHAKQRLKNYKRIRTSSPRPFTLTNRINARKRAIENNQPDPQSSFSPSEHLPPPK